MQAGAWGALAVSHAAPVGAQTRPSSPRGFSKPQCHQTLPCPREPWTACPRACSRCSSVELRAPGTPSVSMRGEAAARRQERTRLHAHGSVGHAARATSQRQRQESPRVTGPRRPPRGTRSPRGAPAQNGLGEQGAQPVPDPRHPRPKHHAEKQSQPGRVRVVGTGRVALNTWPVAPGFGEPGASARSWLSRLSLNSQRASGDGGQANVPFVPEVPAHSVLGSGTQRAAPVWGSPAQKPR